MTESTNFTQRNRRLFQQNRPKADMTVRDSDVRFRGRADIRFKLAEFLEGTRSDIV